jgi:hypothetical protein
MTKVAETEAYKKAVPYLFVRLIYAKAIVIWFFQTTNYKDR